MTRLVAHTVPYAGSAHFPEPRNHTAPLQERSTRASSRFSSDELTLSRAQDH